MSAASAVRPRLAPDPVLPHRDRLLDPEASVHRLRAAVSGASTPGTARGARAAPVGTRARTLQVRYRPGRSLRVTQTLGSGGSGGSDGVGGSGGLGAAPVVSTRGVDAGAFDRLVASSGASTGPGTGVTADPATSSVSWLFPHDRCLASLPEVWNRAGGARHALGPAWAGTELAGLEPERSATLRCRARNGSVLAYARVYATPEAAAGAAHRTARAAGLGAVGGGAGGGGGGGAGGAADRRADGGGDGVPAVLALVPEQCTVLLADVRGEPLSGLAPDRLPPALDGMAATLARLHGLGAGDLPPLRRFSPGELVAAAETVAAGAPELAALAHDVAAVLAATLPAGPAVLVHGDAHLHHALLTATGVTLIDLDEAASGHPAADLGVVLAALRHARLAGALAPHEETALAARFLAAYTAHAGPLDDDALAWHLAAALLVEGAARGVRRIRAATLRLLGPLLDDALAAALPVARRRRRVPAPRVPVARGAVEGGARPTLRRPDRPTGRCPDRPRRP